MTSIAELPSEAKYRRIIHNLILGETHKCPRCLGPLRRSTGYYWCKPCRRKVRPTALTWLYGMKLSYRQLVLLIWAWQCHLDLLRTLRGSPTLPLPGGAGGSVHTYLRTKKCLEA